LPVVLTQQTLKFCDSSESEDTRFWHHFGISVFQLKHIARYPTARNVKHMPVPYYETIFFHSVFHVRRFSVVCNWGIEACSHLWSHWSFKNKII